MKILFLGGKSVFAIIFNKKRNEKRSKLNNTKIVLEHV